MAPAQGWHANAWSVPYFCGKQQTFWSMSVCLQISGTQREGNRPLGRRARSREGAMKEAAEPGVRRHLQAWSAGTPGSPASRRGRAGVRGAALITGRPVLETKGPPTTVFTRLECWTPIIMSVRRLSSSDPRAPGEAGKRGRPLALLCLQNKLLKSNCKKKKKLRSWQWIALKIT